MTPFITKWLIRMMSDDIIYPFPLKLSGTLALGHHQAFLINTTAKHLNGQLT